VRKRNMVVLILLCAMVSFLSIFFHELAHYLVGRALNVRGMSLGLVAVRLSEPASPKDMTLITIAGPIVNGILWLLALLGLRGNQKPLSITLLSFTALLNGCIFLVVLAGALIPTTDANRFLEALGWPALAISTAIGILGLSKIWKTVPNFEGHGQVRLWIWIMFSFILLLATIANNSFFPLLLLLPTFPTLVWTPYIHPQSVE
jgi:hypothetical protein